MNRTLSGAQHPARVGVELHPLHLTTAFEDFWNKFAIL